MLDITKLLDTLSEDELRALIAEAQAILRTRARKSPIAADPTIGMWADREDMQDSAAPDEISAEEFKQLPFFGMHADREDMADSVAWVRREREQWHKRLTREE
jgi:hypothetical protein